MEEQKETTPVDHGEVLANWTYPEYIERKRSKRWYAIALTVVLALIIFSILTSNYLFIIIVAAFVFIYGMQYRRHPVDLEFIIYEDGISPDPNTFYEWQVIKNFWIIYEPPEVKKLYLSFKSSFRPGMHVSLENQNPLNIRKIMLEYIPEDTEKENESFSDGVTRILKL